MTEEDVGVGARSSGEGDLQEQIDVLRAQVTANRSDIDDLQESGQLDHALLEALQVQGASQVELAENLRRALETSRRIGAAVGIVMAQRLITEEAAFELLATVSQNANVKLRDVADRVVETGVIPNVDP